LGSFNSDRQYVYVEAPIEMMSAITVKCRFRGVPWIAKFDPENRYQFAWAYDEPIAEGDLGRIRAEHDRMSTKFQKIKESAISKTDQEPAQKNKKKAMITKKRKKAMITKKRKTMKIKNKSGKIKAYKRRRAISAKSIAKINNKLTKAANIAKIKAKKSKAKEIKKIKNKASSSNS
jgi:hypothetical protein